MTEVLVRPAAPGVTRDLVVRRILLVAIVVVALVGIALMYASARPQVQVPVVSKVACDLKLGVFKNWEGDSYGMACYKREVWDE